MEKVQNKTPKSQVQCSKMPDAGSQSISSGVTKK